MKEELSYEMGAIARENDTSLIAQIQNIIRYKADLLKRGKNIYPGKKMPALWWFKTT